MLVAMKGAEAKMVMINSKAQTFNDICILRATDILIFWELMITNYGHRPTPISIYGGNLKIGKLPIQVH